MNASKKNDDKVREKNRKLREAIDEIQKRYTPDSVPPNLRPKKKQKNSS